MKSKNTIFKKLSCRRGASMIIALLVFFLALLSGTVALTMAASNAGRYTHETEDQQEYLAVASAARLILNRLENVSIEYRSKMPETPHVVGDIDVTYKNLDTNAEVAGDLFLSDERFKSNLKAFSLGFADQGQQSVEFFLTVPSASQLGKVYVNVNILGGDFFFRLWSVKGESKDYQMTMKVSSMFNGIGAGNFQRDDADGYFKRNLTFDVENTIYTVESNVS